MTDSILFSWFLDQAPGAGVAALSCLRFGKWDKISIFLRRKRIDRGCGVAPCLRIMTLMPISRRGGFSVCLVSLAVLLAATACHSPRRCCCKETVLDTCERLTNTFRGFHTNTFPDQYWVCQDGVLHSIRGKQMDLITREKYKDFEFELDWKIPTGANSGIFIGVSEATSETYWSGPEMQINDDLTTEDGKTPNTTTGALYGLIAPNEKCHPKPVGEYNHTRILSRGGHVEYWLNGEKVVEYDWDSAAMKELLRKSKFSDQPLFMKDRNGYISLQSEGDEVWFKNIRIRRY